MKKLLKKLGYGYSIHYNEYRKEFEVYKIGEYTPGGKISSETKIVSLSNPKKAIKKYIKLYRKKSK